jgi:uncharacterized membrane protein
MEITFKYGFTYKYVQYGWYDKKLYRLPHVKIIELCFDSFYVFKSTIVYNIQELN